MQEAVMSDAVNAPTARPPRGALVLVVYTLTTFLSALLLFSIQPMFAKMVLPRLGGSPSVWAVALLFFQGALLVGYAYAHLLIRRVSLARTGPVHVGFSLLACLCLPIGIPESWTEPPLGDPYLWQLGLFAASIGLPFIAVSANAPLLQAWFARTGHRQSADPYFLYAASNLGSLVALLGYPFVLEPVFGLSALAMLWAWGFAFLIAALAISFSLMRKTVSDFTATGARQNAPSTAALEVRPGWRERAEWTGLALVPSALLTAFTTHVATDVASAPLIWVIPLSLYLLTFVLVFRERALIPPSVLGFLHVVTVLMALLQLAQTEKDTWFYAAGLGIAAFFCSTMVAHRTLYEARPAASHLTEFYMWMSLGGVLGGLFSALIAPKLFSEVFEYPLLLALTFACRPGAIERLSRGFLPKAEFALALAIGVVVIYGLPWATAKYHLNWGVWGSTAAVAALFAMTALAFWRRPDVQFSVALLMCLAVVLLPSLVRRGAAERSYFGVYRVLLSSGGGYNVLQHGTTLHGAQKIRDDAGKFIPSTTPLTYYHPHSPMASVVRLTGMVASARQVDPKFGVIGLGTGTLACHSATNEAWRFFEIDPVVVRIAKSPQFTFLKTCQPNADIILGDARLTFAKEQSGSYDLVVVDAFSSDAIPMHLLTAEAIALYASKLKPDGAMVLHISNRYLDLEAVLDATVPAAAHLAGDLHGLVISDASSDGYDKTPSTIVVVSRSTAAIGRMRAIPGARNLAGKGLKPWTDDSSDVLSPFISQYQKQH